MEPRNSGVIHMQEYCFATHDPAVVSNLVAWVRPFEWGNDKFVAARNLRIYSPRLRAIYLSALAGPAWARRWRVKFKSAGCRPVLRVSCGSASWLSDTVSAAPRAHSRARGVDNTFRCGGGRHCERRERLGSARRCSFPADEVDSVTPGESAQRSPGSSGDQQAHPRIPARAAPGSGGSESETVCC